MIDADAVLEPNGELDAAMLFPADTLDVVRVRINSYIDYAYSELGSNGVQGSPLLDRGARVYAYYRAYQAVFLRLSSKPIRKSLTDQGSQSYDKQQHNVFDSLSKQYKEEYNQIMESGVSPLSNPNIVAHTTTAPTEISW